MNSDKEKLVIDLATAITLYPTASKELKTILESTFGIAKLSPNLKDRIKTYQDVLAELKTILLDKSDFRYLPEFQQIRALYTHYMENIIKVFNGNWKPDFTNSAQRKYYCYFVRERSGWSLYIVGSNGGYSSLGSGFYFKNEEDARYVGKQFIDIWSKILE